MRLDEALVARGLFASRSRARDAVRRGTVSVDGRAETRPALAVTDAAAIAVADPAQGYVSRAALKLAAALDAFGLDPGGRLALDVGASTGGFTQLLLMRGAGHVVALDVGHGQLHDSLRADPRVTVIEGMNARDLTAADLAARLPAALAGRAPDMLVCDVSFISLRLALPPALAMAAPGALAAVLVKPQFEAGRAAIGKGGLLKDPAEGPRVAADLAAWLGGEPGWRVTGMVPSPLAGGDGNLEFLLAAKKDAQP
jgi:23S rRNA (cytidine1920-2'-O)/16S rRNA (cytidine1409-2'-O)-methyltransferase